MLLRDFFDGTELKDRLIAAYLIGTNIKEDYFKELKPMYNPKENKGYVSWNTYRKNKNPRENFDRKDLKELKVLLKETLNNKQILF